MLCLSLHASVVNHPDHLSGSLTVLKCKHASLYNLYMNALIVSHKSLSQEIYKMYTQITVVINLLLI